MVFHDRPNIVYILMDDMGYGDMGCYGSSLLCTPHMDRIAAEGTVCTRMYSAPVCSPARAQLLTGCYAPRTGITRVLFPQDTTGLTEATPTIATHLRQAGYATMAIGKWHLGCLPEHMPTRHGFDAYYGLLYSNDMDPLFLYRDETVCEWEVDQASLTRRYTDEAIGFIERHRDRPFFCYLAHTMPHIPLHVEPRYAGRSRAGLYGDVIECIDDQIGRILEYLDTSGLAENTLVIVSSDNGPWYQGSVRGQRGRKFDVYEGGVRVPFIARWPRRIPPGSHRDQLMSQIDILPTLTNLAGCAPIAGIDGKDLSGTLIEDGPSPHSEVLLYIDAVPGAVVSGEWKLHLNLGRDTAQAHGEYPQLFHLATDPEESYNLANRYPDVVDRMLEAARRTDAR